jgi:hypothetical protein
MLLRLQDIFVRVSVSLLALICLTASSGSAQTAITTFHVDNNRTGWNSHETVLTPANVSSSSFGLLYTIVLNGSMGGQPLFVPGVNITAGNYQGVHDVVYAATQGDTIYAIDAESGTVLLSPTFGTPTTRPAACGKLLVGITSTPVIDSSSSTMYVMMDTQDPTGPTYRIHALDLGSLTDKVTPQVVTASHILLGGTIFDFDAAVQKQFPALLLANGNVYAAFGSYCDSNVSITRGMLLGWSTGTLAPLENNLLADTQSASPEDYFLSSIWMSGYGPSTDDSGNILFVTANSDPTGTTYDGVTDIQESVVKVSSDLSTVLDLFTPSNQPQLDENDADLGSGGVMVLPDQLGSVPHLAVAAGKDGRLFLMNEDSLGGFSTTKNNVLGTYPIGGCWCGPSYFVDPSDGLGRVVTSGGSTMEVYKVEETVKQTGLKRVSSSPTIAAGQNPGFFTTISSNGTSNPIIWALSPGSKASQAIVYLYAFNPESVTGGIMQQLFVTPAGKNPGSWFPLVANGEVFVGTDRELEIFGLKQAGKEK